MISCNSIRFRLGLDLALMPDLIQFCTIMAESKYPANCRSKSKQEAS